MGERRYTDQTLLQNSLSRDFMRLYVSISHAYNTYGQSHKCTLILKQFAEYFYLQTIKKKQYRDLRSLMIQNALNSGTPQKCSIFSDKKINGYLYALPAKSAISNKHLKGKINILTVGHGAIQIEPQSSCKFNRPSQRLTIGQSTIALQSKDTKTNFRAKTNVSIFLNIACNEVS